MPSTIELEAQAGDVINQEIQIFNESQEKLEFTISVEKFKTQTEDGVPEFISQQEEDYVFYNWMHIPVKFVVLNPKEKAIMLLQLKCLIMLLLVGIMLVFFGQIRE